MSDSKRVTRQLTGFGGLVLTLALTACGGGGGQSPILGVSGNGSVTPPVVVAPPVLNLSAPAVIAVSPKASSTGVQTNLTTASATFSMPVSTSINAKNFTLSCGAPCTSPTGTVALDGSGTVASLTLSAGTTLSPSTTYTGTINGVTGSKNNVVMTQPYTWQFTTGSTASSTRPSILSTVPVTAPSGSSIAANASISATFSADMAPASIGQSSFTLTCVAPCVAPSGNISYDVGSRVATFAPTAPLTVGTSYTATMTNQVTDLAGNSLVGNQPPTPLTSNYVWSFSVAAANPVGPVIALGTASTFGIFGGGAGMTNMGIETVINGNIGTTAVSTSVTGFHDTGVSCSYTETDSNKGFVNGLIFTAAPPPNGTCISEGTAVTAAVASAASLDARNAYNQLVAAPSGPNAGGGNLAGLTLAPGDYTAAAGSFMIQGGDLTLDAQGNTNAVWIFQMATTLLVGGPGAAAPANVILTNGAQAKNVFWQVGSAATINAGGGGTMVGTIISQAGVAVSTSGNVAVVTLNGRALSLGASVTVVNTVINVPAQ